MRELLDVILKIPAIIEAIISGLIFILFHQITGLIVSQVAEGTVCEMTGMDSWILCFVHTNEVAALFSLMAIVISVGLSIRYIFR